VPVRAGRVGNHSALGRSSAITGGSHHCLSEQAVMVSSAGGVCGTTAGRPYRGSSALTGGQAGVNGGEP